MSIACRGCGNVARKNVQNGVDVAVATRLIDLARNHEEIVVSAADSDFLEAIRHVKKVYKTRIVLASFFCSTSSELMCEADRVIWLDRHQESFAQPAIRRA